MVMKNKFNEQCITPSQMNLIFNVRIFFRRFTTWIRAYIISRYVGVGTEEELFGRLYLESIDFGDIFHVVIGRETSNKFTQLLNQFTFGLRDLLTAHLAGNSAAVSENVNSLYKNADDLAAFLASVSPYFNEAEWKSMLKTYLQGTLEEANSFAAGDYKKDIEIFDRLMDLTNTMGYRFAQAIYDYLTSDSQNTNNVPPQGSQQCMTLEQMNKIYNIRMIWFDLVTWVRNFMLSKYRGIGDVNEVFNRLQQVPDEFVNNLKQVFGDNPAFDTYQLQLNAYVDLIDSLTTAEMKGNTDEIKRITQLLYQNADERAASFSSLNPSFWNKNELQTRLYDNLRSTLDESTSFLAGDYARNLDIFSTLLDQAESISGYIAQGLVGYINSQSK
ncbi:MAG TPA: hypothetical protein VM577_06560 [Anaerovoracaceae bacterium]|nr:hypothetical protein [Anaerovoracaceae bacterium]